MKASPDVPGDAKERPLWAPRREATAEPAAKIDRQTSRDDVDEPRRSPKDRSLAVARGRRFVLRPLVDVGGEQTTHNQAAGTAGNRHGQSTEGTAAGQSRTSIKFLRTGHLHRPNLEVVDDAGGNSTQPAPQSGSRCHEGT